MKIDRSNYEIWFIDRLDGNLNEHQVEQLNLFLSENPDLQEELKEMESSAVIPPAVQFRGKPGLKKTPDEISELQFDYLCAAFIENDLSPEELDEFSLIIDNDRPRRNVSEQFIRLKLIPPEIRFGNKKKLYRRTLLKKEIRLPAVLISTAASVALLIALYFSYSDNKKDIKDNISQQISNEGRVENQTIQREIDHSETISLQPEHEMIINNPSIAVNKITVKTENLELAENESTIPLSEFRNTDIIQSVEVPSNSDILPLYHTGNQNIALIPLSIDIQLQPEKRWAAGRFFARVFRERILKGETTDDSPIKGYEIAEAGVTRLNKLLGWEMAFEKNNDANGEIKSIYFSSKMLKIQAPVNKSE